MKDEIEKTPQEIIKTTENSNVQNSVFHWLPKDLWSGIFGHLTANQIKKMRRTCRLFNEIGESSNVIEHARSIDYSQPVKREQFILMSKDQQSEKFNNGHFFMEPLPNGQLIIANGNKLYISKNGVSELLLQTKTYIVGLAFVFPSINFKSLTIFLGLGGGEIYLLTPNEQNKFIVSHVHNLGVPMYKMSVSAAGRIATVTDVSPSKHGKPVVATDVIKPKSKVHIWDFNLSQKKYIFSQEFIFEARPINLMLKNNLFIVGFADNINFYQYQERSFQLISFDRNTVWTSHIVASQDQVFISGLRALTDRTPVISLWKYDEINKSFNYKQIQNINAAKDSIITSMTLLPEGKLAVACKNKKIYIFDRNELFEKKDNYSVRVVSAGCIPYQLKMDLNEDLLFFDASNFSIVKQEFARIPVVLKNAEVSQNRLRV